MVHLSAEQRREEELLHFCWLRIHNNYLFRKGLNLNIKPLNLHLWQETKIDKKRKMYFFLNPRRIKIKNREKRELKTLDLDISKYQHIKCWLHYTKNALSTFTGKVVGDTLQLTTYKKWSWTALLTTNESWLIWQVVMNRHIAPRTLWLAGYWLMNGSKLCSPQKTFPLDGNVYRKYLLSYWHGNQHRSLTSLQQTNIIRRLPWCHVVWVFKLAPLPWHSRGYPPACVPASPSPPWAPGPGWSWRRRESSWSAPWQSPSRRAPPQAWRCWTSGNEENEISCSRLQFVSIATIKAAK